LARVVAGRPVLDLLVDAHVACGGVKVVFLESGELPHVIVWLSCALICMLFREYSVELGANLRMERWGLTHFPSRIDSALLFWDRVYWWKYLERSPPEGGNELSVSNPNSS
jgi:hypothetical protein